MRRVDRMGTARPVVGDEEREKGKKGMVQKVRKMWRLLVQGKTSALFSILSSNIPIWLFRYTRFYVGFSTNPVQDIGTDRVARLFRNVSFHLIGEEDVPKLVELNPQKSAEKLYSRLRQGNRGVIAEYRGKAIGMIWLDENPVHVEKELFCSFRIPDQSGWIYDAYIAQRFRSRGIYIAMAIWGLQYTDLRKFYGFMDAENLASVKTHSRLGAEIVYEIKFFSILGICRHAIRRPGESEKNKKVLWSVIWGTMPKIELRLDSADRVPVADGRQVVTEGEE